MMDFLSLAMMDIECILELPEKFKMATINKFRMATKINAFHKKGQGQDPGKGQKHIFGHISASSKDREV